MGYPPSPGEAWGEAFLAPFLSPFWVPPRVGQASHYIIRGRPWGAGGEALGGRGGGPWELPGGGPAPSPPPGLPLAPPDLPFGYPPSQRVGGSVDQGPPPHFAPPPPTPEKGGTSSEILGEQRGSLLGPKALGAHLR